MSNSSIPTDNPQTSYVKSQTLNSSQKPKMPSGEQPTVKIQHAKFADYTCKNVIHLKQAMAPFGKSSAMFTATA